MPADERQRKQATLAHNLRWFNINGVLSTLSQNMLVPFTGIFAIKLGASDALVAALSSWPALVSLLTMIPGAKLVDRHPRKKKLVSSLLLFNRIFFLLLALLPFLVPNQEQRPLIFVIMIALMNMPGALSLVAWQSFMAQVIPPQKRGDAFAKRNQLMSFFGVAASLFAGRMMDKLAFPLGFQVMFFIGFLLALLEIAAFNRTAEPAAPVAAAKKTATRKPAAFDWKTLRRSLQANRSYWLFAGASLIFHFGWQMGWPLFTKYQVQVLGATPTWVSIFGVSSSLGSVLAYPIWAKLSNQHGNQRMLIAATFCMALTPFFYAASTQLWMLAVLNLIIGISVAGINLLLLNSLLELCPEQARTQYIAYHNTATNATAVVAPYAGIHLVSAWGIRWALVLTGVARSLGALAFAIVYRRGTTQRRRQHPVSA